MNLPDIAQNLCIIIVCIKKAADGSQSPFMAAPGQNMSSFFHILCMILCYFENALAILPSNVLNWLYKFLN